jgi:hypothetical protein
MTVVPSAKGTLAATPLAHALVYARNHRLTGTFDLLTTDGRRGTLALWRGRITNVVTKPPIAYFGTVVYELGLIDASTLDATLREVAQTKKLHGEILVARGAITAEQRDNALVEQLCRKVHHLFTFPHEATYAFYDARPSVDEPPILVDPLAPIWRGIRDFPPERSVRDVLARIGTSPLRMVNEGAIDRARLPPDEAALCEALALRPMTVAEMQHTTLIPPARVELLAYLLVISKCVESTAGARVHPSTGALPAASPSAPHRMSDPADRHAPSVPGMAAARTPVRSTPRTPAASVSGTMPKVASSVPPNGAIAPPPELGLEGIRARAQSIESENYFAMLGVSDGASAEAVRAAYMRLVKAWHPDRLARELEPVRAEVARIFAHMTRAQQTLCDPIARQGYLATHASKSGIAKRPRIDVVKAVEQALARRDWDGAQYESLGLCDAGADDAEAIALRAWAMACAGEASEDVLKTAMAKLDRAVNVDNTCVRAFFYRAKIAKRLGNEKGAQRDFARTAALDPSNAEAAREIRLFEMRARKAR